MYLITCPIFSVRLILSIISPFKKRTGFKLMYFLEHSGTILFQNIGNIFHFLYQSAPFTLVFRSKFFFFSFWLNSLCLWRELLFNERDIGLELPLCYQSLGLLCSTEIFVYVTSQICFQVQIFQPRVILSFPFILGLEDKGNWGSI